MSQVQDVATSSPSAAGRSNTSMVVPGGPVAPVGQRPVATGAPAPSAQPRRSLRRFILPVLILAGVGYGANLGYNWLVEGRFDRLDRRRLQVDGHGYGDHRRESRRPYFECRGRGQFDRPPPAILLVKIDDGDYRLAVDTARNKIKTRRTRRSPASSSADRCAALGDRPDRKARPPPAPGRKPLSSEADVLRASLDI